MATPAQQSSPVTALPMLEKKLNSSPSMMSYPHLFVASQNNVLVIGGDMNAQIGKNLNHKFSLHNSSNRNGVYLTDFTQENKLTYLNTNFQKREGKLWTYMLHEQLNQGFHRLELLPLGRGPVRRIYKDASK